MPSIPAYTVCQQLGCKQTRSKYNSYCLEHGGRDALAVTDGRRQSNSMYQSHAWRIMRQGQLSLQPLCQACLLDGRVTQAEHVDHVFRWQHIGKGAFYNNLLQSLCQQHHSHKTGVENHGVYEHYTHGGLKKYQLSDYEAKTEQNSQKV